MSAWQVHLPRPNGSALCGAPLLHRYGFLEGSQVTDDIASVTCAACCLAMLEHNAAADRVLVLTLRGLFALK